MIIILFVLTLIFMIVMIYFIQLNDYLIIKDINFVIVIYLIKMIH